MPLGACVRPRPHKWERNQEAGCKWATYEADGVRVVISPDSFSIHHAKSGLALVQNTPRRKLDHRRAIDRSVPLVRVEDILEWAGRIAALTDWSKHEDSFKELLYFEYIRTFCFSPPPSVDRRARNDDGTLCR